MGAYGVEPPACKPADGQFQANLSETGGLDNSGVCAWGCCGGGESWGGEEACSDTFAAGCGRIGVCLPPGSVCRLRADLARAQRSSAGCTWDPHADGLRRRVALVRIRCFKPASWILLLVTARFYRRQEQSRRLCSARSGVLPRQARLAAAPCRF